MMRNTPERRLREAVKSLRAQWGHGWPKLGSTLQQALVRAEVLAEISRFHVDDADPKLVFELTDKLAMLAMQWEPE
ncbi:MAG: hypothetical protein J2P55_00070 [Rhizobiales bacterium]|nr:hypothetical protein [Hyphomicrobiales bacterium]